MEAKRLDLFGVVVLEVGCKSQNDYLALPGHIVKNGRAYFKRVFDLEYERAFYHKPEDD